MTSWAIRAIWFLLFIGTSYNWMVAKIIQPDYVYVMPVPVLAIICCIGFILYEYECNKHGERDPE